MLPFGKRAVNLIHVKTLACGLGWGGGGRSAASVIFFRGTHKVRDNFRCIFNYLF